MIPLGLPCVHRRRHDPGRRCSVEHGRHGHGAALLQILLVAQPTAIAQPARCMDVVRPLCFHEVEEGGGMTYELLGPRRQAGDEVWPQWSHLLARATLFFTIVLCLVGAKAAALVVALAR